MNRRSFLRSLFASSATIVVAPAAALEALEALVPSTRTYVDMGRNARALVPGDQVTLLQPEDGTIVVHHAEGSVHVGPGGVATLQWTPIEFTEAECMRVHAAGGWRLLGTPKRIA